MHFACWGASSLPLRNLPLRYWLGWSARATVCRSRAAPAIMQWKLHFNFPSSLPLRIFCPLESAPDYAKRFPPAPDWLPPAREARCRPASNILGSVLLGTCLLSTAQHSARRCTSRSQYCWLGSWVGLSHGPESVVPRPCPPARWARWGRFPGHDVDSGGAELVRL